MGEKYYKFLTSSNLSPYQAFDYTERDAAWDARDAARDAEWEWQIEQLRKILEAS